MALPACLCGEGLQGGEALSLLAGTTTLAGSGGCRLVERSVAAHPGDHLGAGHPDRSERGIRTVAAEHEAVLRKPPRHLLQHGLGQFVVGRPALAEQPHVDGQPKGLASPGRADPKGEHHQVEPQRVDQALVGGADGVTEVPRSLHLAADGWVKAGAATDSRRVKVSSCAVTASWPPPRIAAFWIAASRCPPAPSPPALHERPHSGRVPSSPPRPRLRTA